MLKKLPHLRNFMAIFFMTHKKTARFLVPIIVLGKLKVFDRLQINPEQFLRRTKEVRSERI